MEDSKFQELRKKLWKFMKEDIYPNEQLYAEQSEEIAHKPGDQWYHAPILTELSKKAKKMGLWNLWFSNELAAAAGPGYEGAGLTNLQYSDLCEIMGTSVHAEFAAQCCNCASPDTGNMETIARFGNAEQKARWLRPLMDSLDTRSCFAMTEPNVASSDASNISISIERVGDEYVINGRKWYITGAGSRHCKIMILMGKIKGGGDGAHNAQSMILVPMDTPGLTILRPMQASGDVDAPKGHMEILYENVRVPVSNILAGEGRGFEIAQARLGPGRIHHCMRAIGTGERAISTMVKRAESRVAFGKKLTQFDNVLEVIAKCRTNLDMARLLVRHTASLLDTIGSKGARKELSMCKAVVPITVQNILDDAMQIHGAMGLSQDVGLFQGFSTARWLRLADGPDAVHNRTIGKLEIRQQKTDEDKNTLYSIPYYENRRPIHFKNPPTQSKL